MVTQVGDISLPVREVELLHLRTADNGPVVVRVEAIDELRLTEMLKSLPGGAPPRVSGGEVDPEENRKLLETYGPGLIEHSTVLIDADGGEVRPAFYFDEKIARHPSSIPGRLLRVEDRALIVRTTLELGGYLGGAAGAGFHGGERSGDVGRVGTLETDQSHGDAPARADGDAPHES